MQYPIAYGDFASMLVDIATLDSLNLEGFDVKKFSITMVASILG